MQDNDIIDLFLSRDEDAITQTSVKYGASLRHIAFGILGDRETAKECENDTYYEAWRRTPGLPLRLFGEDHPSHCDQSPQEKAPAEERLDNL